MNTLDGTGQKSNFTQTYEAYVNDIYRLCFSFMKNHMDAEDIVHETFLKYYHLDRTFDSEQHKKAWLIVTASNACKDMLKHWWNRRNRLEDFTEIAEDSHSEIDGMMSLILELPYQYKMVVYLYYYEGYNSREIADLLHKSESTIRTRLQKAKKILRKELEKDGY